MGFSQGACMAAILAALVCCCSLTTSTSSITSPCSTIADGVLQVSNPSLHPAFLSSPNKIPAFKFLISVGGFLPQPQQPSLSGYFPLPASLQTLHIVGMNDTIVTEERSRTLIEQCETARVEFHEGGTLFSTYL
jgi:hypothetical protein